VEKERWRLFCRIGLLLVSLCLMIGCGAKDMQPEPIAATKKDAADVTVGSDETSAEREAGATDETVTAGDPSASADSSGKTVGNGAPSGRQDAPVQTGDRRSPAGDGTPQSGPSPQPDTKEADGKLDGKGKADGNRDKESGAKGATNPATRSAGGAAETDRTNANTDAAEGKSGETAAPPQEEKVTLSIRADGDLGVILEETPIRWEEGDTVLDVLKRAAKQLNIQMEYRGSGAFAYVEGIDNLYEFDHGPRSGWVFTVNGEEVMRSAGKTSVQAGDRIEWRYLLDISDGEDQ